MFIRAIRAVSRFLLFVACVIKTLMTTIEYLLAALQVQPGSPDGFVGLSAEVDQEELVITALALGLAPLLHYRLERAGRALPEARAQAKLAFARQAEVARQTALRAQLQEILERLPAPPIVLKGAYLAEKVYPAPGLRPMNDIDLLFRPEDLPAAAENLHALGYVSKEKSDQLGPGITKHIQTFKRPTAVRETATPNPYLSSAGDRMIEPHRSLEESWFGLRCDLTPGMWERSVEIDWAGQRARTLAPEDTLLHLAVHLMFHLIMGSPSFVQLADLAVFLEEREVDWPAFLSRARQRRASGYAYAALRLAAQTLNARTSPEVLSALAADSPVTIRAAAEQLSILEVMRRTQQPPLRTLAQRLRRGVADRAETARWAHSFEEWLRVWWTLVDVRRTDTWRMLIKF
jgi:hypothetical protein